ncbi:glycosyl hydrolase family protein [Saccharopolyspora rhizosphaerae]|uniref:Glycosyl hydrolase family protein n=1 Tax=Saccharopolyspora rhizosphaerae TaxID=2492662 RepID=A0A426K0F8_9PSEU|nr:family 1 glycosylhydrolase [Saccharopolyspora rhizosphaerae]RRO18870.1 glycosyl hydrolase family protein [Saccharopolyspora rhizosphaerae]
MRRGVNRCGSQTVSPGTRPPPAARRGGVTEGGRDGPTGDRFARIWSLLDTFERALGFSKRVDLVDVDHATLARTPKSRARFHADVITPHGLS